LGRASILVTLAKIGRSWACVAVGREASGVEARDATEVSGRVTGWLTPFRLEETAAKPRDPSGRP
jgi:hypothetical protein